MVVNNGRAAPPRPKSKYQKLIDTCYPIVETGLPAQKVWICDELIIDRTVSADSIRCSFEKAFPFPAGVKWDGDFIHGTNEVIGSYRNATEWSAMWRGFRKAHELIGNKQ